MDSPLGQLVRAETARAVAAWERVAPRALTQIVHRAAAALTALAPPALRDTVAAGSVVAVYGCALALVALALARAFGVCGARRRKGAGGAPPAWRGGWPLVSHFPAFAANPVGTIAAGYRAVGPVFSMSFLGQGLTFLIGPDAHAPFYLGRDEELSQNEPYKFMTPIFGKGVVFDAPIDIKRQQLLFVSSALRPAALKAYVPAIVEETERFLADWPAAGECDLLEKMAELTILTASRCLLGREVRGQLFGTVARLLHDIDEGINPIAIFFPNLPLPSFRTRDRARAEFAAIFAKIIAARRAAGERHDDMLQAFMEAEYKHNGGKLSDDQITGMLLGVLFAGQHTSAITTTWTLLNLLAAPAYAARVAAEQAAVLGAGAGGGGLTFDSIARLDAMHLAIKETLRQYPPLIMLMRKTHAPLAVRTARGDEYTVPTGHYVFAVPAVSMNVEKGPDGVGVYTAAHKFDPDRFAEGRAEDKAKPYAYSAFGGGIHACLGEQFGYLQVKTVLSIVLREFELTPLGPLPKPDYTMMVVGPEAMAGRRVAFRRRKAPAA